jgi:hypothetical protein
MVIVHLKELQKRPAGLGFHTVFWHALINKRAEGSLVGSYKTLSYTYIHQGFGLECHSPAAVSWRRCGRPVSRKQSPVVVIRAHLGRRGQRRLALLLERLQGAAQRVGQRARVEARHGGAEHLELEKGPPPVSGRAGRHSDRTRRHTGRTRPMNGRRSGPPHLRCRLHATP